MGRIDYLPIELPVSRTAFSRKMRCETNEPYRMDTARKTGRRLLALGALVYLLSFAGPLARPAGFVDLMVHYFPARALLHHSDPYDPASVLREYRRPGASGPNVDFVQTVSTHYPYPPTLFLMTSLVALFPWALAKLLYAAINFGVFLLAGVLIWGLGASYGARLSGLLIAFQLANSQTLAGWGNAACLSVSLCAIAVWCLLRRKHMGVAAVCLAVSIVLKPQDGGLIWLYFALIGAPYRRWAWRAALVAMALALPSWLWVSHVAPNWQSELRTNLRMYTATGGINDPGPTSDSPAGSLVNLQTVPSLFWDSPLFYNSSTYLVCGMLLALWVVVTLRSKPDLMNIWLALAAISALTMLIVYHRRYDTKLLLLAVPACATLWAERGRVGRWAVAITGACFLFTGDGLWIVTSRMLNRVQSSHPSLCHILQVILIVLPAPLSLLAMAVFYLWIYAARARRAEVEVSRADLGSVAAV